MVLTGFKTPNGVASISNISQEFQLFPNGFMSFVMGFQMVFFAYQAIEFIGITTSETANPRQVLPKAIKEIPLRIVLFYGGSLLAIMAIIPWKDLATADSPFVIVFKLAGLKWAAALINFVVLTSAASALNSTLYSTGRHLYQIAHDSPNRFLNELGAAKLSRQNVPTKCYIDFGCSHCFGCFYSGITRSIRFLCFDYCFFIGCLILAIYALTMIAHLKYRKSQEFLSDGYLMPAYKFLNPLTLLFFALV